MLKWLKFWKNKWNMQNYKLVCFKLLLHFWLVKHFLSRLDIEERKFNIATLLNQRRQLIVTCLYLWDIRVVSLYVIKNKPWLSL